MRWEVNWRKELNQAQKDSLSEYLDIYLRVIIEHPNCAPEIKINFIEKSLSENYDLFNESLDWLYAQVKNIELINAYKTINEFYFNTEVEYEGCIRPALEHYFAALGEIRLEAFQQAIKELLDISILRKRIKREEENRNLQKNILWRIKIGRLPLGQIGSSCFGQKRWSAFTELEKISVEYCLKTIYYLIDKGKFVAPDDFENLNIRELKEIHESNPKFVLEFLNVANVSLRASEEVNEEKINLFSLPQKQRIALFQNIASMVKLFLINKKLGERQFSLKHLFDLISSADPMATENERINFFSFSARISELIFATRILLKDLFLFFTDHRVEVFYSIDNIDIEDVKTLYIENHRFLSNQSLKDSLLLLSESERIVLFKCAYKVAKLIRSSKQPLSYLLELFPSAKVRLALFNHSDKVANLVYKAGVSLEQLSSLDSNLFIELVDNSKYLFRMEKFFSQLRGMYVNESSLVVVQRKVLNSVSSFSYGDRKLFYTCLNKITKIVYKGNLDPQWILNLIKNFNMEFKLLIKHYSRVMELFESQRLHLESEPNFIKFCRNLYEVKKSATLSDMRRIMYTSGLFVSNSGSRFLIEEGTVDNALRH